MNKCDKCKYPYDIRKWPCEDCLQGDRFEPKPLTNADRLNAMTVEEKAEWLVMVERRVIENALSKPFNYTDKQLKADWLDWLKQEAEE